MTDGSWLKCGVTIENMLRHVERNGSNRKLRLFAVACCGRFAHLLLDSHSRKALQTSDRFADAVASRPELNAANSAAWNALNSAAITEGSLTSAARAAACSADEQAFNAALRTAREVLSIPAEQVEEAAGDLVGEADSKTEDLWFQAQAAEEAIQCNIFHDIFGSLPLHPVVIDPRWLTSTVVDIAQAIYEERAFDRMPILSDVLMDAGCDSEEIILHCRGDGPHVAGAGLWTCCSERSEATS